ncbi:MAG: DNA polymerase III subunit delta [Muribaculaceae bacterium]|nr:DNA polymerase III subunit delta [Muribaculaceae bacterium]
MAAQTLSFEAILSSVKAGKVSPVYLLQGTEGYFIDEIVKVFENLLPQDEWTLNRHILYAPRVDIREVVDICRRFPLMSDYQIVILKEAQSARADQLDKLVKYIESPSPTTVLVIASRGDVLKGKLPGAVKKCDEAVFFESKKIDPSVLPTAVKDFINKRGLNVQPKALEMLVEYIGADLSRMYNELDKLIAILGQGAMVTPEAIERHIGYSKSFNIFELTDALAARDAERIYRIADYFAANPKAVPLPLATAHIYDLFSNVLITYFAKDKSERGLMAALGLKWPSLLKRINIARSKYNAFQAIEIIRAIRSFDVQSKGIGSRKNEHELFRELMFHILTAPGQLFPDRAYNVTI